MVDQSHHPQEEDDEPQDVRPAADHDGHHDEGVLSEVADQVGGQAGDHGHRGQDGHAEDDVGVPVVATPQGERGLLWELERGECQSEHDQSGDAVLDQQGHDRRGAQRQSRRQHEDAEEHVGDGRYDQEDQDVHEDHEPTGQGGPEADGERHPRGDDAHLEHRWQHVHIGVHQGGLGDHRQEQLLDQAVVGLHDGGGAEPDQEQGHEEADGQERATAGIARTEGGHHQHQRSGPLVRVVVVPGHRLEDDHRQNGGVEQQEGEAPHVHGGDDRQHRFAYDRTVAVIPGSRPGTVRSSLTITS